MEISAPKLKYKLLIPQLYPPLRKVPQSCDNSSDDKYSEIGDIAINLMKLNESSIYKLLSNREEDYFHIGQNEKSIQNQYLKRLVEGNSEYFPPELSQDKFHKRTIPAEELEKLRMSGYKEKPQRKRKTEEPISRKESNADMLAVNKDNDKNKERDRDNETQNKDKKKQENKQETKDQPEINEEEEEKDEENDEELSYEDYRADSDGGSDADGGDFSDGGVF